MITKKRQFGDLGEERAVKFLEQKGYKILERNWRQRGGEIDIVALKKSGWLKSRDEMIVFVEVKTIEGAGSPFQQALAAQNVHYQKQRRLIRTAKNYLAQKKISAEIPWQIDVVIVALSESGNSAKIEHLENAVWAK